MVNPVQSPYPFATSYKKEWNEATSLTVYQRRRKQTPGWHRRVKRKGEDDSDGVRDWSTLPLALLEEILERVPVLDQLCFGWVCKWWRHCFVHSRQLDNKYGVPWLMFCANSDTNTRGCFSVLENRVWELDMPEVRGYYLWGSLHDWLITAQTRSDYLWIYLFNPFTRVGINLPPVDIIYYKAVLSSSPTDEDCVVMLLPIRGLCLSFWIMGSQEWILLKLDYAIFNLLDGVFCNGYFYILTSGCNIVAIKASSVVSNDKKSTFELKPHFHKVGIPPKKKRLGTATLYYLVESRGEVLLVSRVYKSERGLHTLAFEVFKLDVCKMAWLKLESLGDRVLFMNRFGSRCFTPKELGVNVRNCICFTNDQRFNNSTHWIVPREREFDFGAWGLYSLTYECFGNSFRGKPLCWNCVWITAPLWWYHHKNKISYARPNQVLGDGGALGGTNLIEYV
ncbi:hypothetical protein IFM89_001868 [Coptis chinensis]|uniref:KIB1-4 beta-propeller domain-containing protein n=1 Tax=Coptis chinensis TaxID=261450 RepID=A0A835HKE4_9MAGN|nr:hypothetical protein IFM89_001868 [Coptis chinensis]